MVAGGNYDNGSTADHGQPPHKAETTQDTVVPCRTVVSNLTLLISFYSLPFASSKEMPSEPRILH
ncbi:hypothetical protein MLPF_1907 [Mycobacterium lepromatosis]|nr:hypothetical protein MLPF_1907 [Mycobacterium lepromatosis]